MRLLRQVIAIARDRTVLGWLFGSSAALTAYKYVDLMEAWRLVILFSFAIVCGIVSALWGRDA